MKILPSDARLHHRALLLQHLFDGGPASRAELARLTELARVTVSDVVVGLLADDLVEELGVRPGSHMGKPAKLIGVKVTGGYIVALDLSHGKVLRGAVLNLAGATVETRSLSLDGAQDEDAILKILTLARQLIEAAPGRILGIGVGSPGMVNVDGVVSSAYSLGWRRVDLRARIAEEFALPAYVANDADTAALAEVSFGKGSSGGLLLIEISHGVGAGIMIDGLLLRGPLGTVGEIGHIIVDEDGPECLCGRHGCLEVFLGVSHLKERIEGLDRDDRAAQLAKSGDHLGRVLAPITQALGLYDVVLSGPEELLGGPLVQSAQETIQRLTRPFADEEVVLRLAVHGPEGILIGAGALVRDGELGLS